MKTLLTIFFSFITLLVSAQSALNKWELQLGYSGSTHNNYYLNGMNIGFNTSIAKHERVRLGILISSGHAENYKDTNNVPIKNSNHLFYHQVDIGFNSAYCFLMKPKFKGSIGGYFSYLNSFIGDGNDQTLVWLGKTPVFSSPPLVSNHNFCISPYIDLEYFVGKKLAIYTTVSQRVITGSLNFGNKNNFNTLSGFIGLRFLLNTKSN